MSHVFDTPATRSAVPFERKTDRVRIRRSNPQAAWHGLSRTGSESIPVEFPVPSMRASSGSRNLQKQTARARRAVLLLRAGFRDQ